MSKDSCSIVFTGDIGFDRYMSGRWTDPELLSDSIIKYFKNADHVVANVEAALIDADDDGSRGVFFHSMNPEATCVLKNMNADIWNISNNHIMDAGKAGLISTRTIAQQMHCLTIGAGLNETEASEPVYLDEAGGIGMFGVAYMSECIPATDKDPGVFRWDDFELISRRITEVKSKCRWCIIVSHGGEEFADLPNPYTRNRYLKYLELGADIVVAHHPHVPENYETFDNGKAIFYSLGNFIFDTDYQRAHPYTDIGILLRLNLNENSFSFDAMGTKVDRLNAKIVEGPVPGIFEDIRADEYELISPLASAVFVEEERKKMIYLEPERFKNASEDVWNAYFYSTEPDGFDKGAHMDFYEVLPHAAKAQAGLWKTSKLENVKKYLLERP